MEKLIKALSDLRGISGFEYGISDKIKEYFVPYADEIKTDNLDNIIAVKKSNNLDAFKIMIEAHMDEIGLMVKDIDERGFITFTPVGGVDRRILPSLEVVVHGKENIIGVIGSKPPHLMDGDDKKMTAIKDMYIDTGYSADKLRELVSVGDTITFAQSVGKLSKNQLSLKTLDDRAGIAALITCFKKLSKLDLDVDVYAVCATQEEVGLRGAKVAAYGICPDVAIAIDVCHGVTPDNLENAFSTGSGTVISIGPNIHPLVLKRLKSVAKKNKIKVSLDVDGGDTGTDAWAIQVAKWGVPTGLLSIPLKYMHTSVETVDVRDCKLTAELITKFILDLNDNREEFLCY